MIELAPDRVGAYVRALAAGIRRLRPGPDHVSPVAVRRELAMLDPAVSADLLFPAVVSRASGMPAFAWLERLRGEQLATGALPSLEEIARIEARDRPLAARWRARIELRSRLTGVELLCAGRLEVIPRRAGRDGWTTLTFDRITPDDLWARIRVDLDGVGAIDAESVRHLLARVWPLPLATLASVLGSTLAATVVRVSRGAIGPLWSPGVALPPGVPSALGSDRVLHLAHEVLGGVTVAGVRDPFGSPRPGEWIERRFAASEAVLPALKRWLADAGAPCEVETW